jgi:hypothetical protein
MAGAKGGAAGKAGFGSKAAAGGKAAGGAKGAIADARPLSFADKGALVLRGRPGELLGVAEFARAPDAGPQRRVEAARARRASVVAVRASGLPRAHAPGLSLLGAVSPGMRGRVPVQFSVDPATPPGRYSAVFDLAGSERAAEIEVLPDPRLEIRPGHVSVSGAPGAVVPATAVLVNRGNVALELGLLGMLVLQEEEQLCLSLQQALARVKAAADDGGVGDGKASPHALFLDSLAWSLAARKTDFGKVRLARPLTLAPGDAELVELELHLPRDMVAGRQYRALLKAQGAQLFVTIAAVGAGEGAGRKARRTVSAG